eukprot:3111277-Ditylum_brightwellii.AAC.1
MIHQATVSKKYKYEVFPKTFKTATLLDGLVGTKINGVKKIILEHFAGAISKFASQLRTWERQEHDDNVLTPCSDDQNTDDNTVTTIADEETEANNEKQNNEDCNQDDLNDKEELEHTDATSKGDNEPNKAAAPTLSTAQAQRVTRLPQYLYDNYAYIREIN